MKELFKLVWIHPSPPVALVQLYAETRLSDNHLLCQCFKDWLFLALWFFGTVLPWGGEVGEENRGENDATRFDVWFSRRSQSASALWPKCLLNGGEMPLPRTFLKMSQSGQQVRASLSSSFCHSLLILSLFLCTNKCSIVNEERLYGSVSPLSPFWQVHPVWALFLAAGFSPQNIYQHFDLLMWLDKLFCFKCTGPFRMPLFPLSRKFLYESSKQPTV